jgi:2,4-dienoyl-CoA reductase-like NADH-dependent reductase (Old Yellow Enzyme family)
MTSFDRLMEPITLKNTVLPNRLVFPPTVTDYAEENHEVGEPLTDYYRTIAQSKVGLTVIGATSISPEGDLFPYCTRIDEDKYIDGLSQLFAVIKEAGSVPGIQIAHAGRQNSSKYTGVQPVAPSPIPCPTRNETPRELAIEEIEKLEDQFAQGAFRAKQAGAEVIELHGAHGYLINQFLSPYLNKRNDIYGGSIENRSRFLLNILTKTREKVGADLPLICRISAEEFVEGGTTLDDSKKIAVMLAENGLDVISVSGGIAESRSKRNEAMKKGRFLELAKGIKEVVQIPVIAVGQIIDLSQAEKVLEDGIADLVAICRALIVDPELIRKTMEDRVQEINRCIACGECLATLSKNDMRMRCSVNKEWGRYWEAPA